MSINELSGVISGCPLMERSKGCHYTVTCSQHGEPLATCTVLFAVAPAEVAALCNAAFLGKELLAPAPKALAPHPERLGRPGPSGHVASGRGGRRGR